MLKSTSSELKKAEHFAAVNEKKTHLNENLKLKLL